MCGCANDCRLVDGIYGVATVVGDNTNNGGKDIL